MEESKDLYNNSELRGNVISWIPFEKEDRVLEIGGEAGAITNALAGLCAGVDSVECDETLAKASEERFKDVKNVCCLHGRLDEMEEKLQPEYDAVVISGALKYADRYAANAQELLELSVKKLKKNGRLILIAENKYGLKYFAGAREKYMKGLYSTLEGYDEKEGVVLYSKRAMTDMLERAGITSYKVYYPYPDYVYTSEVYSDDYLPKEGSLNDNLWNLDEDRLMVFDESKAFDQIIKDGLFDMFANSFLIIGQI